MSVTLITTVRRESASHRVSAARLNLLNPACRTVGEADRNYGDNDSADDVDSVVCAVDWRGRDHQKVENDGRLTQVSNRPQSPDIEQRRDRMKARESDQALEIVDVDNVYESAADSLKMPDVSIGRRRLKVDEIRRLNSEIGIVGHRRYEGENGERDDERCRSRDDELLQLRNSRCRQQDDQDNGNL